MSTVDFFSFSCVMDQESTTVTVQLFISFYAVLQCYQGDCSNLNIERNQITLVLGSPSAEMQSKVIAVSKSFIAVL